MWYGHWLDNTGTSNLPTQPPNQYVTVTISSAAEQSEREAGHFHLILGLRMSGATSPRPHTSSLRVQEQCFVIFT